jgi:hypothetical protein
MGYGAVLGGGCVLWYAFYCRFLAGRDLSMRGGYLVWFGWRGGGSWDGMGCI